MTVISTTVCVKHRPRSTLLVFGYSVQRFYLRNDSDLIDTLCEAQASCAFGSFDILYRDSVRYIDNYDSDLDNRLCEERF